jgi:hypothetical protein
MSDDIFQGNSILPIKYSLHSDKNQCNETLHYSVITEHMEQIISKLYFMAGLRKRLKVHTVSDGKCMVPEGVGG